MKLGKYKGLKTTRPDLTVREAEIDQVLKNKQRENAVVFHIDSRAADRGDEAVLDFDAECSEKPIPNGKSRSYPLLLGSHTFVKGFEESIVGHMPGDRFDVPVTFPDDYRIPDLRGRDAIFHVYLKSLRRPEYQEIDDDFARDFSGHDTLAAWRAEIRENLEERRRISANEKMARELLDQIIGDSYIPIDPDLKREVADELYEELLQDLEDEGMSFETYCKRTGMTKNKIRTSKTEEAVRLIQTESVLHAIADREDLFVSDEELTKEIIALAEEEGEDPGIFRQMIGADELESIFDQILMDKALDLILENARLLPD